MDCTTLWNNCLNVIRKNVNQQSFKTWFEPIKPVRYENNALTIQVPNKFFYEWLEEHYVALLKMTIKSELGEKGKLDYQILINTNQQSPLSNNSFKSSTLPYSQNASSQSRTHGNVAVQASPNTNNAVANALDENRDSESIKNPFVIPGIKKMKIDPRLNPSYTFDSFIEGDCNRLGRSAGIAISKKPGGTAFNPLVIFGDVGLGKTHLAHAIGNEIINNFPDKNVLYVSCEKFTNQIIEAIKNNAVNDFINFYQFVDILLVDDIQFLSNKLKMQEIFFHIFNQLHQNGKQIVLTSDRAPKDLEGIESRLISRFKWGLTADLQLPDFETRQAILEYKMEKEGVALPSDVIEFISYNIKDNIRELEGVLVSLIAQSSLNRHEIDVDLAKSVVKNFVSEINKEITVDFIEKLVADHLKISVDKLHGKTRKRSIVVARQLSMYLAKKLTNKSLKTIGEIFGGRDHSTVIYSCKTVQDLLDTDKIFKESVEELEKKIKISLNEK